MPPSQLHVQRVASTQVGEPVSFLSGPLANRVVRVQVVELQKAELGRKCGIKDRRPLDPPPAVQVKLFELDGVGTSQATEHELMHLSESIALGFICFVDLFPFPEASDPPMEGISESLPSTSRSAYSQYEDRAPSPVLSSSLYSPLEDLDLVDSAGADFEYPVNTPMDTIDPAVIGLSTSLNPPSMSGGVLPMRVPYNPIPAQNAQRQETAGPSPNEVVAYVNGAPVIQGSCCTTAFVGTTFVSVSCFNLHGNSALLSVFSDLAVTITGTVLIRYRVVNILHATFEHAQRPVLAECWGGPVTIYPANLFPGLQESTDLTKTLSSLGVPVNIRQTERKRRRKDDGKRRLKRLESAPSTG
ncbi:velvet factor [Rhodofomes roseus]|uniref:Velvet factor n=1 Tax=Rhodofomes roseus TaxID=34475 RepID=A0ABQ8KNP5_9APHY|nr:velvet factor [Rhodofomes roseus]KAH9840030.1 velvet factor [Rhodofomes roseus]